VVWILKLLCKWAKFYKELWFKYVASYFVLNSLCVIFVLVNKFVLLQKYSHSTTTRNLACIAFVHIHP